MTTAEHADAFNAGLEAAAGIFEGRMEYKLQPMNNLAAATMIRSMKIIHAVDAPGNSASEWLDGPEPVYAALTASDVILPCDVGVMPDPVVVELPVYAPSQRVYGDRPKEHPAGSYWNPSLLDRLRGWLR